MTPESLLKFDRNFLMALLIPALVALVAQLVLEDRVFAVKPLTAALVQVQSALETEGALTTLVLAVLGVALLLSASSTSIIRFYEGYPFRSRFPLARLTRWRRRRLVGMQRRLKALTAASNEAFARGRKVRGSRLRVEANDLRRVVHEQYPADPNDVLPTRLGNVIRSFESYAYARYNVEAITFWPRLRPILPETLREQADTSAASFQLAIHLTFVLQVLALEALVLGAGSGGWWTALGLALASYGAYGLALRRVPAWGSSVKAAFDLHRRDLLKAYGIDPAPTLEEEKEQWDRVGWLVEWGHSEGIAFDHVAPKEAS